MALAEKVHTLAKKYQVPLIIDDRVDVALAVDAEGVHVGQSDLPVSLARSLMGEDKIVGATTKTVAQAQEAYEQGADYLGVGAIYPTTTKVKTVLTSPDTLRDICQAVPIPVSYTHLDVYKRQPADRGRDHVPFYGSGSGGGYPSAGHHHPFGSIRQVPV